VTDTFKLTTVTADIADQSIQVVTAKSKTIMLDIRDIDKVPFVVNESECPILFPRVDEFLTPLESFFQRDSYGADAAKKSVRYTLHYRLCFAPAIQGPDILSHYADSVRAMVAICLHFFTNTNISGSVEFLPRVENFAPQLDGNNTKFHGGLIAFDVTDYLETT